MSTGKIVQVMGPVVDVEFETEADSILDFSESNPFGEVT